MGESYLCTERECNCNCKCNGNYNFNCESECDDAARCDGEPIAVERAAG